MSTPASRSRLIVPVLCAGALVAVVTAAAWQANRKNAPPPAAVEAPKTIDRDALARETKARIDELETVQPGDWEEFDRTAPARHALAESDSGARTELIAVEELWGMYFAVVLRKHQVRQYTTGITEKEVIPRPDWRGTEKRLLALDSINRTEDRFKEARRSLFGSAHRDAVADVDSYHKTKHFHRAHGIARKHAVDWNATATLLGPDEVAKLDTLRKKCAALANPDVPDPDPDGDPDVAPPPRPKQ